MNMQKLVNHAQSIDQELLLKSLPNYWFGAWYRPVAMWFSLDLTYFKLLFYFGILLV